MPASLLSLVAAWPQCDRTCWDCDEIVALRTHRQGSRGDHLQAFWLPRKGWGSTGPILQHSSLRRGLGDLRGWCVRGRVQTSPGVVERGLSGAWDPIRRVGPVRRQVTESSTHSSGCGAGVLYWRHHEKELLPADAWIRQPQPVGQGTNTESDGHSHKVGGAGSWGKLRMLPSHTHTQISVQGLRDWGPWGQLLRISPLFLSKAET